MKLSSKIMLAMFSLAIVGCLTVCGLMAGNPVMTSGDQFLATTDGNVYTARFVTWDANDLLVQASTATQPVVGIATTTAAGGQPVYFRGVDKFADVQTVATVHRGNFLVSDANGFAVVATAGQIADPNRIVAPCAIAYQAIAADPNALTVRVLIIPAR